MKKIWKWLLFVLVILLAAGCVFLYRYINRIRYNDGYVNGNTAGNLYNEGYFCEKDGIVYFANPADNYCLYSMNPDGTNIKKLEDQSVSYINVDDHYIYYCKLKGKSADSFSFLPINTNSLCRLDIDGKGKPEILDDDPCMYASLVGNYLYYLHYDTTDATTLYKVKIDGKEKEQVEKQSYFTASTDGQYIYYNGLTDNHNIYEMDTSNDHAKVIYEGNCWMPVKDGNNLYFMDCENNYRIAKVDLTNGEKTLVTDCRVDCYNVAGDKIFFQKNDKTDPAICCINTDGSNYQELKEGNYTAINVTSTYVYFKDFTTETPYYTSVAAPGNVQIFNP